MSEGGWDDDDFEPPAPAAGATDKWDGEDEGDDVKDSWDAEDGDGKKPEDGQPEIRAVQRKKKKPLAERIAEKEAARQAAEQKEKEENRELTKEEKRAEAERLRRVQEEADLKLAKEAFGVTDSTGGASGIDAMNPVTEEEFTKFREALKGKIASLNTSPNYSSFLEKLIQELVLDLNTDELKRLSTSTSSIYHEKQRLLKEAEKKKKKKGKDTIKMERKATDFGDFGGRDDFYEEDFI